MVSLHCRNHQFVVYQVHVSIATWHDESPRSALPELAQCRGPHNVTQIVVAVAGALAMRHLVLIVVQGLYVEVRIDACALLQQLLRVVLQQVLHLVGGNLNVVFATDIWCHFVVGFLRLGVVVGAEKTSSAAALETANGGQDGESEQEKSGDGDHNRHRCQLFLSHAQSCEKQQLKMNL